MLLVHLKQMQLQSALLCVAGLSQGDLFDRLHVTGSKSATELTLSSCIFGGCHAQDEAPHIDQPQTLKPPDEAVTV